MINFKDIKNYFMGTPNGAEIKQAAGVKPQETFMPISGRRISFGIRDCTLQVCAKILADNISSIDLSVYDLNNNKQDCNTNFFKVLNIKPNRWQNAMEFWKFMEMSRVIHGNSYAWIKHDEVGNLDQLVPLDATQTKIYINDSIPWLEAQIIYEYVDKNTGKTYTFLPDEIIHLKANSQDGIVGIPTREVLGSIIQENEASANYISEVYANGYSGVMVASYASDLNDARKKALMTQLKALLESQGNRFILPPFGVDLKILGPQTIDKAYVDLRDKGARKIASYLGIPVFLLGEGDGAGSSAMNSAQASAFYNSTIKPIIKQYSAELSYKLLSEKQLKEGLHFDDSDIAGFSCLSATEKIDNLTKLAAAGVLTDNEVRNELGFSRYEDETNSGDKLYRNGAFTSGDIGDSTGSKEEKITFDNTRKAE